MKKLLFLAFLFTSTYTTAATVIHDESVNGDMNMKSFPNFGELSSGNYIINGSMNWVGCPEFTATFCIGDLDALSFSVPSEHVVDVSIEASIDLVMQPEILNNITHFEMNWSLTGAEFYWGTEAINNSVVNTVFNLTPYFNTSYFFQTSTGSFNYSGSDLLEGDSVNMDYTISLSVHQVPVPSAFVFLISGIIFIAGFKKSNNAN